MTNSVDRDDLTYHILARRSPDVRRRADLDALRRPVLRARRRDDRRRRSRLGRRRELARSSTEGGRSAQSIAVLVDRGRRAPCRTRARCPKAELGPISVRYARRSPTRHVTIAPSCAELTGPESVKPAQVVRRHWVDDRRSRHVAAERCAHRAVAATWTKSLGGNRSARTSSSSSVRAPRRAPRRLTRDRTSAGSPMSGVLVHEWLQSNGGSENVFDVLTTTFPDAAAPVPLERQRRPLHRSTRLLARTPLRHSKALALPFMPLVWRHLPAREADWVLCSSHVFAHHAASADPRVTRPKLVYAHTPARYVWVPELDGRGDGLAARFASSLLKPLDRRARRARRRRSPRTAVRRGARRRRVGPRRRRDLPARRRRHVHAGEPRRWMPPTRPLLDRCPRSSSSASPDSSPKAPRGRDRCRHRRRTCRWSSRGPVPMRRACALARRHPGASSFVDQPSLPLLLVLYRRARALVFAPVEDFGSCRSRRWHRERPSSRTRSAARPSRCSTERPAHSCTRGHPTSSAERCERAYCVRG